MFPRLFQNSYQNKRRYREAVFAHPSLDTDPPWQERLRRRLFGTGYRDSDGRSHKKLRLLRRFLTILALGLLVWFIAECVLLWDVFSG
ncbi:MAG: hypothetical protein LBV54_02140 [Puniceicoccales bacterium]|jgi:hypothetical protein|nr:hypothetical protein [Puniceicoccales bacterium]